MDTLCLFSYHEPNSQHSQLFIKKNSINRRALKSTNETLKEKKRHGKCTDVDT